MVACEEKQGKQLSCIWVPDHRNCAIISVCCSKKLNLGVITMQQEIINILLHYEQFQKMHEAMHLTERMFHGISLTVHLPDND